MASGKFEMLSAFEYTCVSANAMFSVPSVTMNAGNLIFVMSVPFSNPNNVLAATPQMIADYDVKLATTARSNRTSYVIAPDGKIIFAYSAMDPAGHVTGTMDAVKAWKAKKKG